MVCFKILKDGGQIMRGIHLRIHITLLVIVFLGKQLDASQKDPKVNADLKASFKVKPLHYSTSDLILLSHVTVLIFFIHRRYGD